MILKDLYYKLRGEKPHICVECEHFAIAENWQYLLKNCPPLKLKETERKAYRWGECTAYESPAQISDRKALLKVCPQYAPPEVVKYSCCSWVRDCKQSGLYCSKFKALEV